MLSDGSSKMGREVVDGDHHVAKVDERQNTIDVTEDIDVLYDPQVGLGLRPGGLHIGSNVPILQVHESDARKGQQWSEVGESYAPVSARLLVPALPRQSANDVAFRNIIGGPQLGRPCSIGEEIGIAAAGDALGIELQDVAKVTDGGLRSIVTRNGGSRRCRIDEPDARERAAIDGMKPLVGRQGEFHGVEIQQRQH